MRYEELEDVIDKAVGNRPEAVWEILEMVANASVATGAHMRENWHDERGWKAWDKIADKIFKTSVQVKKMVPF